MVAPSRTRAEVVTRELKTWPFRGCKRVRKVIFGRKPTASSLVLWAHVMGGKGRGRFMVNDWNFLRWSKILTVSPLIPLLKSPIEVMLNATQHRKMNMSVLIKEVFHFAMAHSPQIRIRKLNILPKSLWHI
ncbi:hypothetical protein RND81_08G133500 [Saponaria officinalis]|uniref:Uncharacterized protein n=1 Tax=Saponaria officinalis TaxID=3572 RepID=A0AAW1J622_SAPOF